MNSFEKILCFLQAEMTEPKAFGWFHCLWIFMVVVMLFLLHKNKKSYSEKQLKIVLGVYGITALILEILKQLIWSFNYNVATGISTWSYQWYSFPFQLCTTPIFVCLICLFLKKGIIRNSLLSYLAYITILGSISTMLLPNSCFVSDILVNIHTMWLHLGSFVVSVYLIMTGEVKISFKSIVSAILLFLFFVFLAQIMNVLVYKSGILNGQTFNMFYISPYFESSLPVFNIIQPKVPHTIFLLIYVIGIICGSFIIYSCYKWIAYKFKTK